MMTIEYAPADGGLAIYRSDPLILWNLSLVVKSMCLAGPMQRLAALYATSSGPAPESKRILGWSDCAARR